MVSAQYLKRLFRTYVHADKRFSVDVHPQSLMLPLTIYTSHAPYAPLGAANHLGRQLAGRPALFLLWFSWTMRQPSVVRKLTTSVAVYRRKWPEHRFILLCNEEEERSAFAAAGVDAVLCSSNAFVDEETFRPMSEVEHDYDAVYNAAMMPWKRHGLASSVETCAHIFYRKDHYGQNETLSYLASLRSQPFHRGGSSFPAVGFAILRKQSDSQHDRNFNAIDVGQNIMVPETQHSIALGL